MSTRSSRASRPTTVREREAASVAAAVRGAIDERWQVDDGNDGWRDARLGDVCILLPTRTSLYFLERALDDAGVPYRAETSSLVYGTREVRDLLMTLRAVDDPSDELALVSALRSSIFGCGDDDLFEFHAEHGGRWNLTAPLPESLPADHPVADAIRFLAALHESRTWVTPSELLEQVVRERHVLEVGADGGRFRDVARRVRFVIDQARAFGDAAGGSLRDYLVWATLQGTEGARVVETVLPETDDDAVRIMTIHGAKGLQFPIVVCSGMSTKAGPRPGAVQVLFPPDEPYQVKLSRRAQTDAFELHKAIDEQMGFAEKLRLLYVACTRARDHLVVSVHRTDRPPPTTRPGCTAAELLWSAAHDARRGRRPTRPDAPGAAPRGRRAPAVVELDAWLAEHDAAFATGARRRFVSATALARLADDAAADDPGVAKEGRDLELPPWNKGRYGTAIGRAVHAVLQTVDLATGAGLADLAAAQAAAEGVLGFEATIAELVQSALDSATVRAACATEYWRETYVAVPVEELTLEGYVDLVYRDADRERSRGRRLQDRRDRRRSEARRRGSRTTRCRAPRTRSRSRRRPASVSTAACSCSWRPAVFARSRSRAMRSPPRSPRCVRWCARSATIRPHSSPWCSPTPEQSGGRHPDTWGRLCHPGGTREGLPLRRQLRSDRRSRRDRARDLVRAARAGRAHARGRDEPASRAST